MNFLKFNVFVLFVLTAQELAESATTYLSNALSGNSEAQKTVYSVLPQTYYVPQTRQKYVTASSPKYVSQTDNQIPLVLPKTVTTTEKALISPTYQIALDTSKYVSPEAAKPTQVTYSSQSGYPNLYTLAKIIPSPVSTYAPHVNSVSNYYDEVPKKYHYGYRVSDKHSGAEFGHSEVNDGLSAKGYYHVLLPDGRLQNVKYWAGPSGYHATITYESKY